MKVIRYIQNPEAYSSLGRRHSRGDIFDPAYASAGLETLFEGNLVPPVDLREDADQITVELELAGLKKADFDIAFKNDVLTISGERKAEFPPREGETVRRERRDGSFSRAISIVSPIQTDAVTASYVDGILRVVLPKAEQAKPKKIEVS